MAILSWTVPSTASAIDLGAVSAESGGDKFLNDGRVLLYAKNTNASTRTITVQTAQTVDGISLADISFTLAQNEEKLLGIFPARYFNDSDGYVNISYSSEVGVTVAAIRV